MEKDKLRRQKAIIFFGLLTILVLLFVSGLNYWNSLQTDDTQPGGSINWSIVHRPPAVIAPTSTVSASFSAPVPIKTVVPELNASLTPEQAKVIAVPSTVIPTAVDSKTHYRGFDIKGVGGIFTPSQITVYAGDRVHIDLTAVDKDYDIVFPSYNMMISAAAGETKAIEFKAVFPGSFDYYCNTCGGANGPAKGKIIVIK